LAQEQREVKVIRRKSKTKEEIINSDQKQTRESN